MDPEAVVTVGWDVGGVQVKAARVESRAGGPTVVRTAVRALEMWRGRDRLPGVLKDLAEELAIDGSTPHALTMTAELSDAFRDKREGVLFVMDGLVDAFPGSRIFALDCDGQLTPLPAARTRPLAFAATNWVASALLAASRVDACILMDVGSTTTDIVPIREGRLACEGRTDLDRLIAGELVYTGVLRTNPNTLTATVPIRGRPCRLAAEQFAVMADAYLLLGRIAAEDYVCPTPDGRAVSRTASAERLARLVCADREMLSEGEIVALARYVSERQLQVIGEGLLQVLSRWGEPATVPVAPAGAGAFLAAEIAGPPRPRRAAPGRPVGSGGRRPAGRRRRPPAGGDSGGRIGPRRRAGPARRATVIDAVVKVGGSLARTASLRSVCARLAAAGRDRGLLVVPGGGASADVVRDLDERFGLQPDTAHWMAVLAMDQYGLLLADLTPGAEVARTLDEARERLARRQWRRRPPPVGAAAAGRSPAPQLVGDLGLHRGVADAAAARAPSRAPEGPPRHGGPGGRGCGRTRGRRDARRDRGVPRRRRSPGRAARRCAVRPLGDRRRSSGTAHGAARDGTHGGGQACATSSLRRSTASLSSLPSRRPPLTDGAAHADDVRRKLAEPRHVGGSQRAGQGAQEPRLPAAGHEALELGRGQLGEQRHPSPCRACRSCSRRPPPPRRRPAAPRAGANRSRARLRRRPP